MTPRQHRPGGLNRRQLVSGAAGLGITAPPLAHPAGALAFPARQDGTPQQGGILKVGLQADPTALDPQKQSLTAIWHVVEHIYNGLTRFRPDLSIEPCLAEGWEISEDGLSYMFVLREGITFHDGTPLTASDVKFTFEQLVDPETASTSAGELASMESVEATDDRTVVMTLKAPDASLLAALAGAPCLVYSEAFVTANNNDVSQVAMGTGPFRFVEYVPNTRVVLERNPDYWEEGLPYLDGIEMIVAADDTARTSAVVTGTVDFIEYAPLRDIELLQQDSSLALAGDSNTDIRFIGLNLTREPFDNPLVRQAIATVVDRDAMLGPTVFGHGTPTVTLFSPDFWAALPEEVPAPDVAAAQALMDEAGYGDGFSTTITSWSQYSFLSAAAVVLQEQLRQIGIEGELNLVENATMVDQVYNEATRDFDIAVTGESAFVDPNSLILQNFKTGESGNFVGYSNPDVDELIDQGIAVTDQEERARIYVVFTLVRLIPGDAALMAIGVDQRITAEQRELVRKAYGLDQPQPIQYLRWMEHVMRGDLGTSLRTRRSVNEELRLRLPVTIELAVLAALLGAGTALAAGVLAAVRRNSALDYGATILTLVGVSVPNFLLATVFVLVFSLWLRWLPPIGYVELTKDPLGNLRTMILPALSLSLPLAAILMRNTRSAVLEVLGQEHVRVARAKGLPGRSVLARHVILNASLPILTVVGIQVASLLGGTVIIETIFGLPGIGRYIYEAIANRDYPVVQGVMLVIATLLVVVSMVVDILYAVLDPRLRTQ